MNLPLLLVIFSAACFGTWPLVTRSASLSPTWLSFGINAGTWIISLIWLYFRPTVPSTRGLGIAIVAGLLNGLGIVSYAILFSLKDVEISRSVAMTGILVPVFACLGALIVLGEPLTARKCIGLLMGALTIYILKPS